jgi:hypothetical protein
LSRLSTNIMTDTTAEFAAMVAARHARMSADERCRAASAMFDVAVAIVESSLPPGLSPGERRRMLARRLYGDELPKAALDAYARFHRDRSA